MDPLTSGYMNNAAGRRPMEMKGNGPLTGAMVLLVGALAYSSPSWSQELSEEATADLLAQAKQMVIKGDMQDAYDALSPHELELAGDIDYDYLLGTAAVDTGHADLAIFALERAIEQQPSFAGARVELARAYFEIGDNEKARYHFEYLLGQNPPPAVQNVITSYLRSIDRLSGSYKPIHLPQFAAGVGFDTNANASTGDNRFLFFLLDDRNVETDSPTYFATLGDYYSRPLTANTKLILTGAIGQKNYPDASFVDATNVNANVGLEYNNGDTKFMPTLVTSYNWLDGDKNLGRVGLDLLGHHSIADDWKLIGGVSGIAHRYDGVLEVRDVDIYDLRAGFEHYLNPQTGSSLSLMVSAGTDKAKNSDSIFENGHWNVSLSGSRIIGRSFLLGADASFRNTEYKGAGFPGVDEDGSIVGVEREDDEFRASVSLHWFDWPGAGWRTVGQVRYSDVDSSVDLYTYDRAEVGLTFHRAFD
jgi:outer membrane protein